MDESAAYRGMWFAPDPPPGFARFLLNVVPDGQSIRTRSGSRLFANLRTANPVDSIGALALGRCLGVTGFYGPTRQFYTVAVFADTLLYNAYVFVLTGIQQVFPGISSDPAWTVGDAAGLENTFGIPLSSDFPVSFATLGKDLFMAGPFTENRIYRLRFENDGSIFQTEAFALDRAEPRNQRGIDDPPPYQRIPPQARIIGSNGTRLFVLDVGLGWSNLADGDAWPAQNTLDLDSGQADSATGLLHLGGAIHAFKQRSVWRLAGDFTTIERTRADLVGTAAGLLSHRALVASGTYVLALTSSGVRSYDGNTFGPSSLSEPIDTLLRSEQSFAELGDEVGRIRITRTGIAQSWSAYNHGDNSVWFVFPSDIPDRPTVAAVYHLKTEGWTFNTIPTALAGAWIPSYDGHGYFVTGDDVGTLFVHGYGPNDTQTNRSSGAIEEVAIDARVVTRVFHQKNLTPFRPRFARVRVESTSDADVSLLMRPVAGSAPTAGWPTTTFDTLPLGSTEFTTLAGATGNGWRLATDRLETDTVVDVKRGVPGYPAPEWYFSISSNALDVEWKAYSVGADIVPVARR